MRITVGGDKLEYNGDAASSASNLLETKILLNNVISDSSKGTQFMYFDIKDHFLVTLMQYPEYIRVRCKYIPDDIQKYY